MKLTEHQERLEQQLPSYINYQTEVARQHELHPNEAIIDKFRSFENFDYAATVLDIRNGNYVFNGVKEVLYDGGLLVAEFCHYLIYGNVPTTKFLYLPLAEVLANDSDLLPTTTSYDSNLTQIDAQPIEQNLFVASNYDFNGYEYYLNLQIEEDYSHPFLPNFYFTGRVIAPNQYDFLYEYFDDAGVYGLRDKVYLSDLKPLDQSGIGLRYPYGFPRLEQLEMTNFYFSLKSLPVGEFKDKLYGYFTGFTTTEDYSNHTYFLYEDTQAEPEQFLSKQEPFDGTGYDLHIVNNLL